MTMNIRGTGKTRLEDRGIPEQKENKLYIGNLDPRVTEYHIINLFRPFGTIVREEFAWHTYGVKKGEPRGFCFIEFSTKEEATKARDKMRGKQLLGRPLTIHFADEQTTRRTPSMQVKEESHPTTLPPSTTTATTTASSAPQDGEGKKEVSLSKEAMDAKIFAIKTKLKLMEKDDPAPGPSMPTYRAPAPNTKRYEPYSRQRHGKRNTLT